jgi:hypothetical protein
MSGRKIGAARAEPSLFRRGEKQLRRVPPETLGTERDEALKHPSSPDKAAEEPQGAGPMGKASVAPACTTAFPKLIELFFCSQSEVFF